MDPLLGEREEAAEAAEAIGSKLGNSSELGVKVERAMECCSASRCLTVPFVISISCRDINCFGFSFVCE